MKELLTVKDVSRILRMNPKVVRYLIERNEIKAFKVGERGRPWRVDVNDLKKYIENCKIQYGNNAPWSYEKWEGLNKRFKEKT